MEHIALSLRQRTLLHTLKYKTDYITGEKLARKLNVSSRTIRTDINTMNKLLKDCGIEIDSKRSMGYLLKASDPDALTQILKINDSFLSRDERVRYIVYKLCIAKEPINLYDLEDEMFISSTTLELDLKLLRKKYLLDYPYINLYKKKNFIHFEHDEYKRRELLNRIFTEGWDYNSTGNAFYNYQYFDENVLYTIMNEIKAALMEYRIKLEDITLIKFALGIAIVYSRISDGFYMEHPYRLTTTDKISIHMVNDIFDALEIKFDITFPILDREPFYVFMSSSKLLNADLLNFRTVTSFFDPDIIELCDKYIEKIHAVFSIDLSKDEDFYITVLQLFRFIKMPLKNFNNITMQNSSLRTQYMIEFEIAYLIQPLALKYLGSYLSYTELIHLVFCISGALSYYNRTLPKIRTAILCHYNLPVTWNLKHSILEKFSDFIDIQTLLPVYSKDTKDFANIDLLLSTVTKSYANLSTCKTLQITPYFTEKDQQNLQHYINETRIETLYPTAKLSIYQLLEEANWIEKSDSDSYLNSLKLLYNDLKTKVNVDDNFLISIMRREAYITFAHQPNITVLYEIGDYEKTAFSVMTFNHRIRKNDNKIRIMILAAIAEKDSNSIFLLLNKIYNSSLDTEELKFMTTKEEILHCMKPDLL